jgi:hypothetical protein
MPYTAADRTIEQVLKDYETGVLNAEFKGSTLEYLHAVIAAKAAQTQQRWARVAAFAASGRGVRRLY